MKIGTNEVMSTPKFIVTAAAKRPESTNQSCSDCKRAIGETHQDNCWHVRKRVKVRVTLEYEIEVQASWNADMVEYWLDNKTDPQDVVTAVQDLLDTECDRSARADDSEQCPCVITDAKCLDASSVEWFLEET